MILKDGLGLVKSIKNMRGRLQIIEKGSLKNLAPSNMVICDVAHNPSAGLAISNHLNTLDKNNKIYMICGMMDNKIHDKFLSNFKQVSEIVAVDIPNNENWYINTNRHNAKYGVCRIWKRGLTDDEILQNFNAQRNRFGI